MVLNSNIFNSASSQDSSSQASFNGGKAQGVEAPVYTQAFEAGNKEADLLLTPVPYGFDLFESHLVSSSAPVPAPVPTPTQAAHPPTNQDGNLDLEQLPAASQPAPLQSIRLKLLWPSAPNNKLSLLSGLTIIPLWNPRPRSRNQTRNLDPPRPPGQRTARLPACIFLGSSP
ncbi:hypothetical protein DSO57_1025610 [Entomophthora muscae]|uniref:Uncharacterized protein n=1 Tax=Entomophthora muscae TaxID=34485 RepID=A0ACC2SRI7_9FUNG|nr:hypothetical protein DSO57_1025610 [Entomophthora muscae]